MYVHYKKADYNLTKLLENMILICTSTDKYKDISQNRQCYYIIGLSICQKHSACTLQEEVGLQLSLKKFHFKQTLYKN